MESIPLGETGIVVSRLGLGMGHLGRPLQPEVEVERLLLGAIDRGITLFDAAPSYGLAEERMGRLLGPRRREVVLSTKCGYGVPGVADWTGPCVEQGVELACARLKTEVIDLMFLHSCPRGTLEAGEVVDALVRAKRRGLVRAVGYSGENDALLYAVQCGAFDVIQTSVNLCDQWSLLHVLPEARRRGIGVVAKRPLANAFWRHVDRPAGDYSLTYWDRARRMELSPHGPGLDWAALALRFSAFAPGVSAALVGTSSFAHLAANLDRVALGALPAELSEDIERRFLPWAGEWGGDI